MCDCDVLAVVDFETYDMRCMRCGKFWTRADAVEHLRSMLAEKLYWDLHGEVASLVENV